MSKIQHTVYSIMQILLNNLIFIIFLTKEKRGESSVGVQTHSA